MRIWGDRRMNIVVTGCFGFIASYLCKYIIKNYEDYSVLGIARNPHPKNENRIEEIRNNPRFNLIYKDLAENSIYDIVSDADVIVHAAARTFVDFSIRDPKPFVKDNIVATFNMLEAARKSTKLKRYIQISTDEVYGAILSGKYTEDSRPNPTNPYAATKMAADALVIAYHNSYGLPTIITRTENNYGIFQGKEKAIPTFVRKALNNEPLPIYGDGKHVRCWLHVEDHVRAILHLIENGKSGEIYHVAGEQELQNLELGKRILRILSKPEDLITFIPDHNIRPGHDRRYALNVEKLKATGWSPKYTLEEGLQETVLWYRDNMGWLQ